MKTPRIACLTPFPMLLGLVVFASACNFSVVRSEPREAISVAESFVTEAFVRQDFEAAVVFASKEKATLNNDALKNAILQTQGSTPFPTTVRSTAYETPFGQRAVVVYLQGECPGESCFYRIVTVGDVEIGYSVMEVLKSKQQFPKNSLTVPIAR